MNTFQRRCLIGSLPFYSLFSPFPTIILIFFLFFSFQANAVNEIIEMELDDLTSLTVRTASKVEEPVLKTISTTSVVTASEIEANNCRDFSDVLRLFPNVDVGKNRHGATEISIRGVTKGAADKVQLLLNGALLNSSRDGSSFSVFQDRMSLENIERVELVKGAGSALYGANAFLAVINVVTYSPKAIQGNLVTAQTQITENGFFQKQAGVTTSLNRHLYLSAQITSNETDFLTMNSSFILGNEAGEADVNTDSTDIELQLHYQKDKKWHYQARFLQHEGGDYYGDGGRPYDDAEQYNLSFWNSLDYAFIQEKNTEAKVSVYLDYMHIRPELRRAPENTLINGVMAPGGIKYVVGNKELNTGVKLFADHQIEVGNNIHLGVEYSYESIFDSETQSTFDLDENGQFIAFYPDLRTSEDKTHLKDTSRNIYSVYAQDLWDITSKLRMSLGGRYDYYSDFGGSFNPKAGLSYAISPKLSFRTNVATAYRAPDFFSLYFINNPLRKGNPDLKPEKNLSAEMGIEWAKNFFNLSVTLFRNEMTDMIRAVSTTPNQVAAYDNIDSATYRGFESSLRLENTKEQTIEASYSYNYLEHSSTNPGYSPEHNLKVIAASPLRWGLKGGVALFMQSESKAPEKSNLPNVPESYQTDLNLSYPLSRHAVVYGSVKNLFDNQNYYPIEGLLVPTFGRSLFVKLAYDF